EGKAPTFMPATEVRRLLSQFKDWQNPDVVEAALDALKAPEGLCALTSILTDKDANDPDLRASAACALGEIGPAAKEALPVLLAALKHDEEDVGRNRLSARS